jgi:hypothetical protein
MFWGLIVAPAPHGCLLNCDLSDTVGFTPHICKGIHDGLWPVGIRPPIQADTSESQDILELAQSAFVASKVYGELIILVGVPESVVWEVV